MLTADPGVPGFPLAPGSPTDPYCMCNNDNTVHVHVYLTVSPFGPAGPCSPGTPLRPIGPLAPSSPRSPVSP